MGGCLSRTAAAENSRTESIANSGSNVHYNTRTPVPAATAAATAVAPPPLRVAPAGAPQDVRRHTIQPGHIDFGQNIKWVSEQPMTYGELLRQREAFWDTAPVYEGRREIWQALKLAIESEDYNLSVAILESTGIVVPTGRLLDGAYDEFGACYKIPRYCLCSPQNLVSDNDNTVNSRVLGSSSSSSHNGAGGGDIRALAALAEEVGAAGSIQSISYDGNNKTNAGDYYRASIDSGQSMEIKTAVGINSYSNVSTPNIANGTSSSALQSPFVESDTPTFSPNSTLRKASDKELPVIIRLVSANDVEIRLSAETTIADIEQQLKQLGHIPWSTPRVRFFYLGRLLNSNLAPVRDMKLSQSVVIQAMYAQPS